MAKKIILNCDGMNGGTVNMPNFHYPHDLYLNELNQIIDLKDPDRQDRQVLIGKSTPK